MARIRSIKPEFPQSESMGRVSRDARLTFIMLWTISDDEGRLRGNSRMLASLLFPYDDDAKRLMDKWLAELETEGCITRYSVGTDSYIQIVGWTSHQKIDKPSQSKLPKPPESSRALANPREPSPLEGKGEEGIKDQGEDGDEQSPPPVISIPLNDNTEYPVSKAQADEWQAAYPAVNVMQELREMRTWSAANPSKRKTPRGIAAFVVRWLGGEQDKGGKPKAQFSQPAGRHTDDAEDTRRMLDQANRGTTGMPAEIRQFAAQLTGRKAA
jgi:hypothetical protein